MTDRREFLRRSAMYFTVASAGPVLSACGGGGGGGGTGEPAGSYVFAQGVATGDPKADSVVFWTRVQAASGKTDDIGLWLHVSTDKDFGTLVARERLTATATYDHTVRLKLKNLQPDTVYYYRFLAGSDVSPVARTRTAPAAGSTRQQLRFAWFTCQDWSVNHWGAMDLLAAEEDLDFTVHVGDYIYESVGASFQTGAVEPAHALIRLPDGATGKDGSISAVSLADYRTLYRTYRSDKRLQAIHHKFPLIAIWDDHEFSDDCWKDHQTYNNANLQETSRRRNANQAWVEYMPVDMGDVSFDLAGTGYDNIRIYRSFQFGPLMDLIMTDERLYRDDHVIPEPVVALSQGADAATAMAANTSIGARYLAPLPNLLQLQYYNPLTQQQRAAPSMLGASQTQWWKDQMSNSRAAWKIWGNEVPLSRMWVDLRNNPYVTDAQYKQVYVLNADVWDGYPAHKATLMQHLTSNNIQDVVAITGDLHAFQCGVVRDAIGFDPSSPPASINPPAGTAALVDFVTAGISSSSFFSYLQSAARALPALQPLVADQPTFEALLWAHPQLGNNPDLKWADHHAQGYASATVTAERFMVDFKKVKPLDNGQVPASPLASTTRITLARGSKQPVITTV